MSTVPLAVRAIHLCLQRLIWVNWMQVYAHTTNKKEENRTVCSDQFVSVPVRSVFVRDLLFYLLFCSPVFVVLMNRRKRKDTSIR